MTLDTLTLATNLIAELTPPRFRAFLGVSEKTLERRLKDGEWNTGERLKLEMVGQLLSEANRVYDDPERALLWLHEPVPGLGNKAPFELLDSIAGYERAKASLLRGALGMF